MDKGRLQEFDLGAIATFLESLEESIIYKALDRAQFGRNAPAYLPGASGFPNMTGLSLLDIRLYMQEQMDARFGRFCVPEERPFTSDLPKPDRLVQGLQTFPLSSLDVLAQGTKIMASYPQFLDDLCLSIDDGQWGSAVEHDVYLLQAIARRIHFGALYVSEAKYRASPSHYDSLRKQGDSEAILMSLTRPEVEERILLRVMHKVDAIQAQVNPAIRRLVDPGLVKNYYQAVVIPLTKAGELAYLLARNTMGEDRN